MFKTTRDLLVGSIMKHVGLLECELLVARNMWGPEGGEQHLPLGWTRQGKATAQEWTLWHMCERARNEREARMNRTEVWPPTAPRAAQRLVRMPPAACRPPPATRSQV